MKIIEFNIQDWVITFFEDGEVIIECDDDDEVLVINKDKMKEIIEAYQKLC